jgi:hypothetical protein
MGASVPERFYRARFARLPIGDVYRSTSWIPANSTREHLHPPQVRCDVPALLT